MLAEFLEYLRNSLDVGLPVVFLGLAIVFVNRNAEFWEKESLEKEQRYLEDSLNMIDKIERENTNRNTKESLEAEKRKKALGRIKTKATVWQETLRKIISKDSPGLAFPPNLNPLGSVFFLFKYEKDKKELNELWKAADLKEKASPGSDV